MSIAAEVGQRIRFYRKERNMSQERLAEVCNFHPTYIGQLERGEKNATLESIYRITQGLEISMSQFLEHIDAFEKEGESIPLQVYHQLLPLSREKQKKAKKVWEDILELME